MHNPNEPTLAPLGGEIPERISNFVQAGCPGTPYEHCTPSVKLMWALTYLEQREAELLATEGRIYKEMGRWSALHLDFEELTVQRDEARTALSQRDELCRRMLASMNDVSQYGFFEDGPGMDQLRKDVYAFISEAEKLYAQKEGQADAPRV